MTRTLKSGDKLGRFELLAPIGSGGMGAVWVARPSGPGAVRRLVAIKTMLGGDSAVTANEQRFLDEARVASLVRHPNVLGLYELGDHDGTLYFAMDWCDGATLAELLDALHERRLEPAIAASIAVEVCAGLHAAHETEDERGEPLALVHRDVSPHNVLIGRNGHVRLGDFGVSLARGRLSARTNTGELLGKLGYLAPEQVLGSDVDRRADVFALGCVLYESSVGRGPFLGEEPLAALYRAVEIDAPAPSSILADYPPRLERIVVRALRKLPAERFQSADAMARELELWLSTSGEPVRELAVARVLETALGPMLDERNTRITALALAAVPTPENAHVTSDLGIVGPTARSDLDDDSPGMLARRLDASPDAERRARTTPFTATFPERPPPSAPNPRYLWIVPALAALTLAGLGLRAVGHRPSPAPSRTTATLAAASPLAAPAHPTPTAPAHPSLSSAPSSSVTPERAIVPHAPVATARQRSTSRKHAVVQRAADRDGVPRLEGADASAHAAPVPFPIDEDNPFSATQKVP